MANSDKSRLAKPPTDRGVRLRNFCFVYHNWTPDVIEKLRAWSQITYACIGEEICPDTGTPHLQCYVECKQQVLRTTFQNVVGKPIHAKPRWGTPEQAANYCKKDDKYHEWGEINKQGRRSDLEVVRDIVTEGSSMRNICVCPEITSAPALRSAELMMKYIEPLRSIAPIEVVWAYGDDAIDRIYEDAGEEEIYEPLTLNCWEGYDAHDTVHLRLPDIDSLKDARLFEKYLDKYPFRVNNKGASRQARYTKLYISTPYDELDYNHYLAGRVVKTVKLTRFVTRTL